MKTTPDGNFSVLNRGLNNAYGRIITPATDNNTGDGGMMGDREALARLLSDFAKDCLRSYGIEDETISADPEIDGTAREVAAGYARGDSAAMREAALNVVVDYPAAAFGTWSGENSGGYGSICALARALGVTSYSAAVLAKRAALALPAPEPVAPGDSAAMEKLREDFLQSSAQAIDAMAKLAAAQRDSAAMREALQEAERFMAYFSGETQGFVGSGMPRECLAQIRAALALPAPEPVAYGDWAAVALEWAVDRWNAEVKNRPLRNIHRRSLDDTWRQMIRYLGGDPDALVGPSHDDLMPAPEPVAPVVTDAMARAAMAKWQSLERSPDTWTNIWIAIIEAALDAAALIPHDGDAEKED